MQAKIHVEDVISALRWKVYDGAIGEGEEQKEGESDIAYVKRFLAENMKAHMRLKAQNEQVGAIHARNNALPKIEAEVIDEGTIE